MRGNAPIASERRPSIMRASTGNNVGKPAGGGKRKRKKAPEYYKRKTLARRQVFKWLPVVFENDSLHGSWWFVYASALAMVIPIFPAINLYLSTKWWPVPYVNLISLADHTAVYIVLVGIGLMFTIGSYFLVRAFAEPAVEPLFPCALLQNDEIVACWFFFLGCVPAIPICIIYLHYLPGSSMFYSGATFVVALATAIMLVFTLAIYPHPEGVPLRDLVAPLLHRSCCGPSSGLHKHVQNDWQIICWLFLVGSVFATVACVAVLVYFAVHHDAQEVYNYATGLADMIMIVIGCMYFLAGSYPTDFESEEDDDEDEDEDDDDEDDDDDDDDSDDVEATTKPAAATPSAAAGPPPAVAKPAAPTVSAAAAAAAAAKPDASKGDDGEGEESALSALRAKRNSRIARGAGAAWQEDPSPDPSPSFTQRPDPASAGAPTSASNAGAAAGAAAAIGGDDDDDDWQPEGALPAQMAALAKAPAPASAAAAAFKPTIAPKPAPAPAPATAEKEEEDDEEEDDDGDGPYGDGDPPVAGRRPMSSREEQDDDIDLDDDDDDDHEEDRALAPAAHAPTAAQPPARTAPASAPVPAAAPADDDDFAAAFATLPDSFDRPAPTAAPAPAAPVPAAATGTRAFTAPAAPTRGMFAPSTSTGRMPTDPDLCSDESYGIRRTQIPVLRDESSKGVDKQPPTRDRPTSAAKPAAVAGGWAGHWPSPSSDNGTGIPENPFATGSTPPAPPRQRDRSVSPTGSVVSARSAGSHSSLRFGPKPPNPFA